ncbi:S-layer domain-containing protein [Paenibacillus sp. FSL R7-277]|uniref:DUF4469 domain-containing protein n=1 Tax=unclassified Paenibacillus TaxID=185978 RepID=UPI0003E205CB|nr:DUF4469 domain-containing protein [Paenibacillus sp. FSL R7-277]ETT79478.1 S-layer domain-containing protein [Paenibacillus sp. FSL R7-277]
MSDMSYTTKEKSQFMNVQGGEKKVMKKILSVALSTAMAFSMFASVAFGETAKVTSQQAFDALAAKGVVNGFPDGKAHLDKDLTRGEFAKIVTKLFGLTEVTGKLSYNDKGYNAKNWAVPYIEAVTAAGLMQGQDTVKGIFNYNGKVTVEEVAKVLAIALKLEQPTTTDNSASVWAKGYAQAVINAGLVEKTANFKANALRSLVVETAYYADQIGKVPTLTVASAEAVSPTKVVVTFSDKTTANVELTTALVAGVEQTINFKHLEKDYTAKVTLQAPKVVSVTTPNSKQVVVKFNRTIDTDTVAESSRLLDEVIKITKVGTKDNDAVNANVTFNADNTEAVITLANVPTIKFLKGNYNIEISGDIRTTSAESIPAFLQTVNVADTVAPTIVSTTAAAKTNTKDVYVKFSEPVKTTGIVAYVNGVSAQATATTATYDEFKLTGGSLDSGKTYDVSLQNVSDYAGNTITPNPTKTTVTVTSDVAAPVIKSVTPVSDRFIEVEFDKTVDRASLVGNVRLLNSSGESQGTFSVLTSENGKKFTLQSPRISFPSSNTFTGSVVFGANVKDTLGNILGTASNQAITFTKDTVAPTVTNVTYSTTTANKGIALRFTKDVDYVGKGTVYLISESTGESIIVPTTGFKKNNEKTIVLPVPASVAAGKYTLRVPAGLVKDKSYSGNENTAQVLDVTLGASSTDDKGPELFLPTAGATPIKFIDSVKVSGDSVTNTVYGEATITVDLKDPSGLNSATLIDPNSYTLDGKALPAGSFPSVTTLDSNGNTIGSTKNPVYARVTIKIPSSAIETTKTDYEFIVSGVTDTVGNGIDGTQAKAKGKLTSRIKPTLNTAAVSGGSSTELILGFSKDVVGLTKENLTSNLQFFINNDVVDNQAVKKEHIVSVTEIKYGSDKGKWSVKFSKQIIDSKAGALEELDLNANEVNRIIVKVVKGATFTDGDGNVIKDDTNEIYAK